MMAWLLAHALLAAAAQPAQVPLQAPVQEASFLDEKPTLVAEPPRSMARAVGMTLVVLMMAAGVTAAFVRSQKPQRPMTSGDQINLLAYKPIGGKQRLALVEVCGERLLLSANEREVTLLSHLPGSGVDEPVIQPAQMPEAAAAPGPVQAVNQTVADLEQALAGQPQSHEAPEGGPSFSADLAGLQQWQHRAQSERRA
jgi:flagellar biogenesis protein FliO